MLYADATLLWRLALPRVGWWRRAQRPRLPIPPLRQSHSNRDERLTRQAWWPYRAWSRITSGVWRSVMGAVQDGTSRVFAKIVPHVDAQERRQYRHQVMRICGKTGTEGMMVAERSGLHRAHQLDATLDHSHGTWRRHCLPAHGGHHLNPSAGFWRVMQDTLGAGRCCPTLHRLYQRTRQVLMTHQERPIYELHW